MTTMKTLRMARGWSQMELAKRAGCSGPHISDLENGRHNPSFRMLHRVAQALGVSDAALLADYIPSEDAPLPPVKSAAGSSHGS